MAFELGNISSEIRKHTFLVRGLSLGLATVFILMVVTVPLFGRAKLAQSELASKRIKADGLSNQVIFLNNIDPEVLKTRVQVLDLTLPPKKDILIYLSTIDGLSRELELSLKGVQLSPGELASGSAKNTKNKTTTTGVRSLETQLSITGSYDGIFKFLNAIEDTAPLMRVKDVKVSKTSGNSYILSVILSMMYADVANLAGTTNKTVLFDESEEKVMSELLKLKSYRTEITASSSAIVNVGKSDLFAF